MHLKTKHDLKDEKTAHEALQSMIAAQAEFGLGTRASVKEQSLIDVKKEQGKGVERYRGAPSPSLGRWCYTIDLGLSD